MLKITNNTTITAPATANGGAINIIRLSGNEAISIADKIFKAKKEGLKLSKSESHRIYFGDIIDGNEILDEVLISVFTDNKSFTGEPSIEISLHASPYIMQRTLELLVENGAKMAEPGEFSMRAFLNGKLDLAQAEAVADLIASNSKSAHQTAMKQLKGEFSDKLKVLRQQLLDFASLIELELDFAEEDVEFADRSKFIALVTEIKHEVVRLINSFKIGNVLKTGIPVAIVGKPNVGKSTLLNALLQEDKAIVSDIAGTTRDVIEDVINIEGVLFRFIDTAGIRTSADKIEAMGIERTFKKIEEANIVFLLCDAKELDNKETLKKQITEISSTIDKENQKLIVIINKVDKAPLSFNIDDIDNTIISISAKNRNNIDKLEQELLNYIKAFNIEDQSIVTNARHLEALKNTNQTLDNIIQAYENEIPTDLIAIDVRDCLYHLGSITGQIETDELLGNIFGKFCIGK